MILTLTIQRKATVIAGALAMLAGCGSPTLALAPESPVELSGRWYLDRGASDDTVATVRAAIKDINQKPVPVFVPGEQARIYPPATGATLDGLREALPPDNADLLDIRQGRSDFSVDYAGLKKSSYRNGLTVTVFDGAGTGKLSAGWDRDDYVIFQDYESAFTLRQAFRLDRHNRLQQTIEIRSSRLKHKVVIVRYYDSEPGQATTMSAVRDRSARRSLAAR